MADRLPPDVAAKLRRVDDPDGPDDDSER